MASGNPYPTSTPPAPPPSNTVGLVGFILSLVGIVVCGLHLISLPVSLIGLTKRPRGLAAAGTVISLIGTLAIVGIGALFVKGVAFVSEEQNRLNTGNALAEAEVRIHRHHDMHGALPDGIEGNKMILDLKDAWGESLRYDLDGDKFVIRSAGPDKRFDTPDDLTSKEKQVETELNIDIGGSDFGDGPVMIPEGEGTSVPNIDLPDVDDEK